MTDFTFSIYNNDVTIASNFLLLVTNWVVLYYTSKRRTRNFTDVHVLTFKLLQFPLILTSAHHAQYPHLICGFACLPNGSNAIVMRLCRSATRMKQSPKCAVINEVLFNDLLSLTTQDCRFMQGRNHKS